MISLHYTSHTKAYNTIHTACNIVEAIYSFTVWDCRHKASVSHSCLFTSQHSPVPIYTAWWQRHMGVNNLP